MCSVCWQVEPVQVISGLKEPRHVYRCTRCGKCYACEHRADLAHDRHEWVCADGRQRLVIQDLGTPVKPW